MKTNKLHIEIGLEAQAFFSLTVRILGYSDMWCSSSAQSHELFSAIQ